MDTILSSIEVGFVNSVDYSSYELYSDGLRAGVFLGGEGGGKAQLTMTVGKDRRVKDVKVVDSDKKIH